MFLQQLLNGIVLGSIYTLIALGLTMIFGILDITNFAHGEFFMLGAFFTLLSSRILNLPFFPAMFVSMGIVAGLGMLFERIAFRPLRGSSPVNVMVGSLGLSILVQNSALLLWGADPQRIDTPYLDLPVSLWGLQITAQRLLVIILAVIMIIVLTFIIKKTRLGKAMRACAQDLEAAQWMGININRIALSTFFIGSALAASAGAIVGPIFLVYPTMGLVPVLKSFVVVILGGMGNVPGAILGGYVIGIAENMASGFISPAYKDAIAFIILIVVLIIKPSGIFGRYVTEKV
jgi:branched-chain amino acid transport system permease protein